MNINKLLLSIFFGLILLVGCSSNKDNPRETTKDESRFEDDRSSQRDNIDLEKDDDPIEENEDDEQNNLDDDSEFDEDELDDNGNEDINTNDNVFVTTEDGDTVLVEINDIVFSYPNILSGEQAEDQFIPTFDLYNEDQTILINVAVEELPMVMTTEEYITLASENFGLEYDEISAKTNANGVEFTEAITEQTGVLINQRVFIFEQTAYVFSYASATYEENLNVYDEITNSVSAR